MTILVIAEHDGTQITPATRATIGAAQQIGGEVHLALAGHNIAPVIEHAKRLAGITKVLVEDDALYAHPLAEALAPFITQLAAAYTHVLAPATTQGKDVMPRVAALLDVQQISEITKIISADTFVRPIYAGNALQTVQSSDAIKVITVRATAFDKVGEGNVAEVVDVPAVPVQTTSRFVGMQEAKSDRPELTSARVVVSGGRGLGSAENFKLLEKLADKLGAAMGASRAAVDAGYVPNDWQVGQTGKVVAPELYIAVGISGAIQHLAGMKESKVIVAINKDENAPIFEIADYGLVGDLFELLPQLEAAL
ncbi:MAG: electron transfer flavoprotein subunit alpha [Azospirillum brasilense]|nr:MAG: electron transfer flavoprotein subunit alpha [Azospirillum brasilense]